MRQEYPTREKEKKRKPHNEEGEDESRTFFMGRSTGVSPDYWA